MMTSSRRIARCSRTGRSSGISGMDARDGFAALVNYHQLDRPTLERLTFTYLGDWIERQTAGVRDEVAGAEERLVAAQDLQRRLELILDGEPPYDIFVRWKPLAEQPIGWDPDLNDGVRLNARPFVEAGVLRSKFTVHWKKDRGKNPDGSERHNDLHYTPTQTNKPPAKDTPHERDHPRSSVRRALREPLITTRMLLLLRLQCSGRMKNKSGSRSSPNCARVTELSATGPLTRLLTKVRRIGYVASSPRRSRPKAPRNGLPIIYLPGVSRDALRALEGVVPELAPLGALQHRCQWFSHPNGKDWTVRALLSNKEKGLGLEIAADTATAAALVSSLSQLARQPWSRFDAKHIDADFLNGLLSPDPVRSLLNWLDDPTAMRKELGDGAWSAFRSTVQR